MTLPGSIPLLSVLLLMLPAACPEPITVYLIGDSTMSDKPVRDAPETGWGMPFKTFFDESVTVENHAVNGRSTRTFIDEGRWTPIAEALEPGDWVIIQFGHNDEVPTKEQYTPPGEYIDNLSLFVRETRAAGATPVLMTPVARRRFDDAGKLVDTHAGYSALVRMTADSLDVPLVDMDRRSRDLLSRLGPECSRFLFNHIEPGLHPNYPDGVQDDTHFNELGARRMAELALAGIRQLGLEPADRVVGSGDR